jgi:hypothetical protein
MSFRLVVRVSGDRGLFGVGEYERASDAFALYRRVTRSRARVEEIVDLRGGGEVSISSAELEAIALRERCRRYRADDGLGDVP